MRRWLSLALLYAVLALVVYTLVTTPRDTTFHIERDR